MEIIDLSRELFHRTQTHPSHPPVIMTVWNDHSEKKVAGDTVFTSKALSIALSDHAGTHVDAPVHFDPRPGALSIDQVPLANFITSTFCIDLSHVPLKHAASVAEVEAAVKQREIPGAGYAWDYPALGQASAALLPAAGGTERLAVRPWPAMAAQSAAEIAGFFAQHFSRAAP